MVEGGGRVLHTRQMCPPETQALETGLGGNLREPARHGSRGWRPPTGLRWPEPRGSGVRLAPRLGVRGSRAGGGAQVLLIHKGERPRPAH